MLGFLKNLATPAKPTDTQIWDCRPLTIEHLVDGIIYSQHTEVEFVPNPQDVRTGHATAKSAKEGWQPDLTIVHWLDIPQNGDPRFRLSGMTLFGYDAKGNDFTWYIDSAADQLLIDKERCEISYPCLPAITEADLMRLNADATDSHDTQTWICRPLIIIDDEGDIAYQGETSIDYTEVGSGLREAWLQANFVTEDGWQPVLHAVIAQKKGLLKKDEAHNWNFRGYDREGLPFTWLMGTFAEEELIRREDHRIVNEPA